MAKNFYPTRSQNREITTFYGELTTNGASGFVKSQTLAGGPSQSAGSLAVTGMPVSGSRTGAGIYTFQFNTRYARVVDWDMKPIFSSSLGFRAQAMSGTRDVLTNGQFVVGIMSGNQPPANVTGTDISWAYRLVVQNAINN